ncbi:uncharacterized protein LOC122263882 [Penaeus japonicus]|uniref:uncharacterized protein LOC122263882 n=1 Tax=Penaeus japonicus TaxID=27405 RepID=UPI001C714811|nr:uncharacterized protein LOC122263882 [Penaeus japonicus]
MQPSLALVFVALLSGSLALPNGRARLPQALLELRKPLTNIDFNTLKSNMSNRSTVEFYVQCVINGESCDRVGNALRNLLVSEFQGRDMCYDCTDSERQRVQYVIDVLHSDHKDLACDVHKFSKFPLFGGKNPCV